ncbi:MAG: uncharacterized protein A8A55_2679 [Amphiamblys sp. WSBS2006]|nr:MAG: uncharacterized protein A8A55_2679 [Amphiamblys sp. WSBS2006]
MEALQRPHFAKHERSYFLCANEGILVTPIHEYKSIEKEVQSLLKKKKELLLEKILGGTERRIDASCMSCSGTQKTERVFLLRHIAKRAKPQDCFTLTTSFQNSSSLLLTKETVVFLESIAVSDRLLFVFLAKTKVVVGEGVSVFSHSEEENDIKEYTTEEDKTGSLVRHGPEDAREESLFLENIERIPPNSIDCVCNVVSLVDSFFVNILPKMKIHKENEIETFVLGAGWKKGLFDALKTKNEVIDVGKVLNMRLYQHAINILPFLKIHEENEAASVVLAAYWEGDIAKILEEEKRSVRIGKTKTLRILSYAVNVLPVLRIDRESSMDLFELEAYWEGDVAKALEEHNGSIWVGRIKEMRLHSYAISILLKLRIHGDNEMERLVLAAYRRSLLFSIPKDGSFYVGRVKNISVFGYAIAAFPLLRMHEKNKMECFELRSMGIYTVSEILRNNNIRLKIGDVGCVSLDTQDMEGSARLEYTLVGGEERVSFE